MNTLLQELAERNLLDSSILHQLSPQTQSLSDLEKLRHLVHKQLVEESSLSSFFTEHYQIPLAPPLSEFLPFPEAASFHKIYQTTKITIGYHQEKLIGLISIQSDLLKLDDISIRFKEIPEWHWVESQALENYYRSSNTDSERRGSSVSETVEQLIEKAILQRASDLHLESGPTGLRVRYRVDGRLQEENPFPIEQQGSILSRIKILCGMDIAIKRQPQEGHHRYISKSGHFFDLRASTLPTESGEKLVIRILDQAPVQYRLDALGFFEEDLRLLDEAVQSPSGLILVVGPTGSGKTTTLYGMLNALNSSQKNILTIEDPVEYHIAGINQVSVQPKQNVTFASALKTFLRQDPDVILVGEIRDQETAEVALKAALTGHLVLTTLHCTDALTALQRLENLGITRDLLADTLQLILAQRLVRRVCPHESEPCGQCQNSGYLGRVPVYEILKVNPWLKEQIRKGVGVLTPENHSQLIFRPFHQTAQRLQEKGMTDVQAIKEVLGDLGSCPLS